jgi:diadenosine tetraphosphate (Ap4A) HIT family hydrolase
MESPFLEALKNDTGVVLSSNPDWFVLLDSFPARPGHMLVIPKRQFSSYFEVTPEEWENLHDVIQRIPELMRSTDLRQEYESLQESPLNLASQSFLAKALGSKYLDVEPTDFTIAVNEGTYAGRTVDHLHLHFVPRYEGDVADPTGGFRHMFPGDGNYTTALSALGQANLYYNTENLALQYFRTIREVRGPMPYLRQFLSDVDPSPEHRIAELGFGPGIELERMLKWGHHIDGVDISGPMNIQLQRILDKKGSTDPDLSRFQWRDNVRLFPYSLQDFPTEKDSYVRIWSQATFLHLDRNEIAPMLNKFGASLKRERRGQPESRLYVNFKVGESEKLDIDHQGRPFSYFTKESFRDQIVPDLEEVKVKRMWVPPTKDKLGRTTQWLNVLLAPK